MSTNPSQHELKFNRFDALVALIIALLAVAAALWFYLPRSQSGQLTVVISVAGEETRRVPLSDFTETTVTGGSYTLRVSTRDGGVAVTDSDCPTQDCVHTGVITRAGQSIVCLPAQVVVHLEGTAPDAPDVIVG
jgi:putative membrane associated protein